MMHWKLRKFRRDFSLRARLWLAARHGFFWLPVQQRKIRLLRLAVEGLGAIMPLPSLPVCYWDAHGNPKASWDGHVINLDK
jgi:hypothetical protein